MTTPSEACWQEITRTVALSILDSNRLLKLLLQQTRQRLVQQHSSRAAQPLWIQAQQLLERHQTEWEQSFALFLLEECAQPPDSPASATVAQHDLHGSLDTLDWGDGSRIQAQAEFTQWCRRIEAHLRQPLHDFQRILAAAHGLSPWHTIHNPLHPNHYLQALEKMVCQSQADPAVCHWLLQQLYPQLSPLLEHTYRSALTRLSESGACDTALATTPPHRAHRLPTPPTARWSKAMLAQCLNPSSPPQPIRPFYSAAAPSSQSSRPPARPSPLSRQATSEVTAGHAAQADSLLPDTLHMGAWFQIGPAHQRVTSRLSWHSQDRTVFLFTAADGRSQTMTRRRLLHLLQTGALHPSDPP